MTVRTADQEHTGGATSHRAASAPGRGAEVRSDIQGLRAIAVSAVVIYHLWPKALSGGYAGVDVFFVISGFLITSHLLARPPRRPRDAFEFWSRRIRRLLPASLLVLLLTLVASRLLAPETQWLNTARQIKAAALYVVNWRLANDSVDYLAAHNAPSPVQHFWSLSVEEQFYLGWPLLIIVAGLVARLLRRRFATVVTVAMTVVVAASLWYSVHATDTEPARAYFVTWTRIWELGIGGLLAAALSKRAFGRRAESEAVPLPAAARIGLAWLGLAAIAVTAFTYTGGTPFPGWRALLPTLGTAAVIAACAPRSAGSPGPLLALRPMQWLGNISYSVYLWHWPLIVLVPYAVGGSTHRFDKLIVVVASLVLAALSKRLIEDRFRTPRWGRPLVKPYALAALGMAVVVAGASWQVTEVQHRQNAAQHALEHALASHGPCFGAAAMVAPPGTCRPVTSGRVYPALVQAGQDRSIAYASVSHRKDCFAYLPSFAEVTCHFGRAGAPTRIALVGNSHAGEWVTALDALARADNWSVTTYLASQCAYGDVRQTFDTPAHSQSCLDWVHRTTRTVAAGHYDLVIMVNRISVTAVGADLTASQAIYQRGYENVLRALLAAGEPVLGIRDTPAPGRSIPDCLAAHPSDYSACNGSPAKWLPREPLTAAAAALHNRRLHVADFTRYFCRPTSCPAVIGGVVGYFDGSHMTSTFSRTLEPYLRPYVVRGLAAGR